MSEPVDLFSQAVSLHRAGDLARAERLYRHILVLWPDHEQALSHLGAVLSRRGKVREAEDCFRALLRLKPGDAGAWARLGTALTHRGRSADAVECFRAALGLPDPPVGTSERLWRLLFSLGRDDEAVAAIGEHLWRRPDDAVALHVLGLALARLGRPEEAVAVLRRAAAARPDSAVVQNAFGVALDSLGQVDEAFAQYQRAVVLRPDLPEGLNNLAVALIEQGRSAEAVGRLRRSLALNPAQPVVHSNLLLALHYLPDYEPVALLAEHRRWAAAFADPLTPAGPPAPADPDPDRPLRVGYVSADLRTHPVAAFLQPVLESHDRSAVHVTCYANVRHPDVATRRLRATADAWRDITGLGDADAAEAVRRDRIDVLVDLDGHTAGSRLLLFARRPAPVQVTLFGYPNTTGLRAMDYRVTESVADPPGVERHYAERLVRLPEVAWCYGPPAQAPAVGPLPADAAGAVTFAALNNPAKMTEQAVALWCRVLKAVPASRLLLLGGRFAEGRRWLVEQFHGRGADGRVEVVARRPPAEYLALYNRVDVALDPFPYNGGVTTCDALWMGVPVVSLAGRTYAARQGASLLRAVGLPGLVAQTPEEYVAIAARWANDLDRLRAVRTGLREQLRRSPVCDAVRYTRHLENAFRALWQERLVVPCHTGSDFSLRPAHR